MSWRPHITVQGTCICDRGWEAEGRVLHIRVGRLVVEFTIARVNWVIGEVPDAR